MKLLLIGWDAADWKVIRPMMEKGLLPNLKKLVDGGVSGNLATLDPPLSPLLWTSISTGKRPYKHGVTGFVEPGPDGKGIAPITVRHRRVKAIWNILTQQGLRTHVLGWWPSHPAEPVNGVYVSNFYQHATKPIHEPWHLSPGTVHPSRLEGLLATLRVHPSSLSAAHLRPFVQDFDQLPEDKKSHLDHLARVIADNMGVFNAATYAIEQEPWDFCAVYFDGIDHFSHGWMKYYPPKRDFVPEEDFRFFNDVVPAAYQFHDAMLGRLLSLAGNDTCVMLLSDHGFHPDHLRPQYLPDEPAGPAFEHGPYGIFVLNGAGVKKGASIAGASLLDVAPTILALYGLPLAKDMDGKPLLSVFEQAPKLTLIPSWEEVEGADGSHPKNTVNEDIIDPVLLEQLVELGYIEMQDGGELSSLKAVKENDYYLARAYMDGGLIKEAVPLLEKLFEENPSQTRYGLSLAACYNRMGLTPMSRGVLSIIKENAQSSATANGVGVQLLESQVLMAEDKPAEALSILEMVFEKTGPKGDLLRRMGSCWARMGQWEKAMGAYQRQLGHNPQDATAHMGLGIVLLQLNRPDEAAEALMSALELDFNLYMAHYHLGEAFFQIKDYERAAQAFEVSLRMAPKLNRARQRLAILYEQHLGKKDLAAALKDEILPNAGGLIYIVSGMPRSGTSMMMRMLYNGGMEMYTDGKRPADENNPHGYFEHEAVLRIARDQHWLAAAEGKVVKVVAPLLRFLPPKFQYKIVFMERELSEVVASQAAMLRRSGKAVDVFPLELLQKMEAQLSEVRQWATNNPNVEMLYVSFQDAKEHPKAVAMRVNQFLGGMLVTDLMAEAVVV